MGKVIDDRFGDGAHKVSRAKEVYDSHRVSPRGNNPSGKPMTDDEFVRAFIKNELYGMDRQKDFSIDDEKFALETSFNNNCCNSLLLLILSTW